MLEKITDRVFYMKHNDETDRPALGLICGDKYSLIVDSGNSPKHAQEFLAKVNMMNVPPVKYLVITHWHWDHVFGIKDMNLITISHENTKEKLEEMKGYKWDDAALDQFVKDGVYNDFTIECIKKEIEDRDNFTLGDLDITYRDNLEIDLGGVTCIIKAIGGEHTTDASVVYIPEERVLFLGDCIYGTRYNGEYGYTKEKIYPMIAEIERLEADYFIISHQELFQKKDINEFFEQIRGACEAVGTEGSIEEASKKFLDIYNREPSEDEAFYIKCFANVNKALNK